MRYKYTIELLDTITDKKIELNGNCDMLHTHFELGMRHTGVGLHAVPIKNGKEKITLTLGTGIDHPTEPVMD